MTDVATVAQTSNPERRVPTRRMSFEESMEHLPRAFAADGDLISGHVIMALSSVFPDGEDYFVRSVRHYRDRITDPALKRQVSGFIGQEAVHGREHRVFNDRLAELGYPTKRYERFTKAGLRFRERILPPLSNLAATAALEHFTATLAELVLTSEEIRGAIEEPVSQIIDAVKQTLDRTPPELASDIMDRGIMLAGGGSLLQGIEERLRHETQMPAHLAESPLTCVAVGSGRSLEEFEAIHRSSKNSRNRRRR